MLPELQGHQVFCCCCLIMGELRSLGGRLAGATPKSQQLGATFWKVPGAPCTVMAGPVQCWDSVVLPSSAVSNTSQQKCKEKPDSALSWCPPLQRGRPY